MWLAEPTWSFNKAIEKELQKNPGIRKEVEEYTDQIEQIHKKTEGIIFIIFIIDTDATDGQRRPKTWKMSVPS